MQCTREIHATESPRDMDVLLSSFPNQPLDFFGAIRYAPRHASIAFTAYMRANHRRASTYDSQIREWIKRDIVRGDICEENENMTELGTRLLSKQGLPEFKPVQLTIDALLREGQRLVHEQEMVNSVRLAPEYLKMGKKGRSIIGLMG